jgi:hypothetical protein
VRSTVECRSEIAITGVTPVGPHKASHGNVDVVASTMPEREVRQVPGGNLQGVSGGSGRFPDHRA